MLETLSDLCQLTAQKNKLEKEMLTRNQYARCALSSYRFAAKPSDEYNALMEPASRKMDELLLKIMDAQQASLKPGPKHFRPENVFVWGGPTPNWGGSMDPATSIRGAEYFHAENVVYVYGPIDEKSMELHRNCKKLICQITRTARIPGVPEETDEACAERLSRLSLKYPNIIGGIADDLVIYLGRNYSAKDIKKTRDALKKHNPALDMYGVVYARELDHENIFRVAECLDVVNLWIDRKSDWAEFDMIIEKCRVRFPGKKILLGIFMQDISLSDLGYSNELMIRVLQKAEAALHAGKIQDIVILGDREIAKFPELAGTIRNYLDRSFAAEKSPGNP